MLLLTEAMEAINTVLDRSAKVLDGQRHDPRPSRQTTLDQPDLVYDPDWDEAERLARWQQVTTDTKSLPPVQRAAILIDAWVEIDVLQRAPWLGPLFVSALLRREGLSAHHLPAWSIGAKQIPRERRRAFDRTVRLIAFMDALREGAMTGLKEHDRLLQAKAQMERRLKGKRSNSKLPALIAFTLSRPLITAPLAAKELKLSLPGALNLICELGLREVTGRGRFRAWAAA